ncbi:MAG: baseplate J/gp47 family protein [Flavobacteriaceae bacterium]
MSNNIDKILKRSGTDQEERFLKSLNPENFDLHDFSIEDWILFAYNFAKNINYYGTDDDKKPSGDWQCFFNDFELENEKVPDRTTKEYDQLKDKISEVLATYKETHDLTPHLTLFVCFLQLLKFSKERFNTLTKRHLDFYYKNILHVDKLAPIEDQVHILFELARKSNEEQIVEGTELNAQKDAIGNQRIYKTKEEIIVNKSKVASLKTIYNGSKIKASQVANTLDGKELPLPEEAPYWYPFGYTSAPGDYSELEDAEIGFALSSPLFNLKEGLRTIAVTIDFTNDIKGLSDFTPEVLKEIFTIYGSGEEDWVGPIELIKEEKEEGEEEEEVNEKQLKLLFQLDRDSDALVNYNEEFLLKKYNTKFPVIRFLLKTNEGKGSQFYKVFTENSVEKITIKVDVEDAKEVVVENDNGILKTAKPFYPFTTQPVKNSNFYINYPEVFSKQWSRMDIHLKWKNAPQDFKSWYQAYLKTQRLATTKKDFKSDMKEIADADLIVKGNGYFTAEKAVLHKEVWDVDDQEQVLFSKVIDVPAKAAEEGQEAQEEESHFESNIHFTNSNYDIDKVGSVRLSLEQTFLHELYPRLYALALTTKGSPLIPNEPYTPLIEEITLNYVAEETIDVKSQVFPVKEDDPVAKENTETAYEASRIKLFHEEPFGQHEEHNYLKISQRERGINDIYDGTNIYSYLLPKHCKGGELFIGLEDAEVSQTVSLLIQVLEGSENPLVPSFKEDEEVDWSVLCDGKWKDLKEYIISNNTDNFLTSGIIKISIPAEATKDNTLLPENFIWLRARMHKSYDAVCKAINIQAQAVVAEFENNDNDVSHLDKGLPAKTIKKMMTRIPQVKGLEQPYTSFGGLPEESDLNFYRRISERLRHKNRAITLWDYEHLILQEFPEIYKVKCLNHTSGDNFTAAGEVTIVVIPDTVNKNVFDIYEPRVSKGLLNKVETYINQLNAKQVKAKIINPNYEKVTITLEVKFHEGLDKSFYAKRIDEDIIKFLSPWAFDDTKEIAFGITLHRSVLIDYLEKLDYVDYLQRVTMQKDGESKTQINISPSDPKSILVSAKEHSIKTNLTPCKGELKEEEKECQA